MTDPTTVDVVLNAQQMELLERLREELGLETAGEVLRHGLLAQMGSPAGPAS